MPFYHENSQKRNTNVFKLGDGIEITFNQEGKYDLKSGRQLGLF